MLGMSLKWARYSRWAPGPAELVFVTVLGMILIGGRHGLLGDPGTPWHLKLGREILAQGSVPSCDTLTFTHEGDPWVDQSWAFDVMLAGVVNATGWSGAIALAALGLAALYAALARADSGRDFPCCRDRGCVFGRGDRRSALLDPPPSLYVRARLSHVSRVPRATRKGGLADRRGTGLHGDPCQFARRLRGVTRDRRHGGSWSWNRGSMGSVPARELAKFGGVLVASVLAGLLNPYGVGLYRHVARLLFSSGVTSLIIEYQPAPFGKPEARRWNGCYWHWSRCPSSRRGGSTATTWPTSSCGYIWRSPRFAMHLSSQWRWPRLWPY